MYLEVTSFGDYTDFTAALWHENYLRASASDNLIYSACIRGEVLESVISRLFPRPSVNSDLQCAFAAYITHGSENIHSNICFLLWFFFLKNMLPWEEKHYLKNPNIWILTACLSYFCLQSYSQKWLSVLPSFIFMLFNYLKNGFYLVHFLNEGISI